MAESVDALVSNTSGAIRAGSTPAQGTEEETAISCLLFFFEEGAIRAGQWSFLAPVEQSVPVRLRFIFFFRGGRLGGKMVEVGCINRGV